jgi:hypothetical protein
MNILLIDVSNIWDLKEAEMRDVKRIDKILKLLEIAWKNNQDMRLGQLIENIAGYGVRIWHIEDDDVRMKYDWVRLIKAWNKR